MLLVNSLLLNIYQMLQINISCVILFAKDEYISGEKDDGINMAHKISEQEIDFQNTIAINIKRLMFEKDLTQQELADKLGVTRSAVSAWCTGIRMPKAEMIDKLCDVLGTDRSGLVERYNYRKKEEQKQPDNTSFTMEDIRIAQQIARLDAYRKALIKHIIETEPEQ